MVENRTLIVFVNLLSNTYFSAIYKREKKKFINLGVFFEKKNLSKVYEKLENCNKKRA